MDTSPIASITFLFANPGESLPLWEQHQAAMQVAVPQFRATLQQVVTTHGGEVFNFSSDTLQAAFQSAPDALLAALQAQRILLSTAWELPFGPRLILMTGSAWRHAGDYQGPVIHRANRLLSVANPEQVILCHITAELVENSLPAGVTLLNLGEHRLPDLTHAERLFQLAAPGLPEDFPPLKSLNNHLTNLPIQPYPFVGRQTEMQTLARLLRSADVRLVTLTGIGGTGKTRLALQTAAELLVDFPDGVYFVPLDQLTESGLVASVIASALSLEISGNQTVEAELKAHLRERRVLLVLDNFEHLLKAASLVSALLSTCSQLKILITSRERLRLHGEREFPLSPLPMPDPRQPTLPEQLTQYAAVALFVQRAQSARPDFSVDSHNAAAIAEICTTLDGLPLAIELAAARVRLFTPQVLLARLKAHAGFGLLSAGSRDLPARQQTLQNTLEWSYNLLNPAEQALFRRLGVFAGGFTLEAVEAVCYLPDEKADDLVQVLASLVDRSLVRPTDEGGEQARYSMLYILQQFAVSLLEQESELDACRDAQVGYYLTLAELAEPELQTNNQTIWLAVLEQEYDNLRAALGWTIATRKIEPAARLIGSLALFWIHRSYSREGLKYVEQVLASIDIQDISDELQVKLLTAAAGLAYFLGDYAAARNYYEQCLKIRRKSGEPIGIARALGNLGYHIAQQGETHSGAQLLEESIAIYRETDDKKGLALALDKRAIIAMNQDNYPYARELLTESLAIMQDEGDLEGIGWSLSIIADIELNQRNYERARELYEQSLKIHQALGQQIHTAEALGAIGDVLSIQGNLISARSYLEQAMIAYQKAGAKWGIARTLEGLARIARSRDNYQLAVQLFGVSEALREAIGAPLLPSENTILEPLVRDARSKLTFNEFTQAWTTGRQMLAEGLDTVIAYVLESEDAPATGPTKDTTGGLTSRESEILRLLAQGLADAQIAETLFISPRTVNAHLTSIYSKLGVNSRVAATRFALENGLA